MNSKGSVLYTFKEPSALPTTTTFCFVSSGYDVAAKQVTLKKRKMKSKINHKEDNSIYIYIFTQNATPKSSRETHSRPIRA